ncbi:helix-turn-helix domain-containing protein [Thalassovita gelatinovora]|uniref:helix-turn-helix domain-containing protein n=1 Tax=Thalassovita gelatinovora TaxID=53501 RepID=UPI00130EF121|nr:AraC family transcriptional regulator [Thalassovita gelatinovora]QIZ81881.1 helix-turn-helix transcriptional regulator [Thalassovita gelatinovora]
MATWSGALEKGAKLAAQGGDRAQVMFCYEGLMRVEVGEDRWFIPDRFGIWIPSGTAPQVEVAHGIEFQTFLLHPRFSARLALPDQPTVLRATPLMRGIARRLRPSESISTAERRRLGWVALDEIARLDRPDLHLPGSGDPRLANVMSHLLAHPRDANSLPQLAVRAGSSERTLSRLFQNETGMNWRSWRDRMRFVLALEGLQMGRKSTDLAAFLGYSSTSAFVAAFRRQSGMTPTEWRHQR